MKRTRRQGPRLGLGLTRLILVLGFTVAITGLGIYAVYSQYQVVRLGYSLDQDLFEHRRELEAVKRLELTIASYKHPRAVSEFAEKDLKMRQTDNRDELIVPSGDELARSPEDTPDDTPHGEEDRP